MSAAPAIAVDPYFREQLAEIAPADADGTVALLGQAALKLVYDQNGRVPLQRKQAQSLLNQNVELESVSHRSNPCGLRNKTYGMDMETSAAVKAGTFRKQRTQPINKSTVTQELTSTLRAAYGQYQSKHKKISQHAGIKSAKTAEAWSCGRNLPALEYFLELGRNSPAIQKMTMRLWGLDADLDPEYSRVLNDLRNLVRAEGK